MIVRNVDPTGVITFANELWRQGKDERVDKEDIWKECWLAKESKFGKGWKEVKNYRSRRYNPITFQAVLNVGSHYIQGIMPHDDWFNVLGRTGDDDKAAKMMASLMKWQHYRANWRQEMASVINQSIIFGNVPWAVLWEDEKRHIVNQVGYAKELGEWQAAMQAGIQLPPPEMGQMAVTDFDGPVMKCGNIFDYVQLRKSNDRRSAPRIMRQFKTAAYIKSLAQKDESGYSLYENLDAINDENIFREASDSLQQQVEVELGFNPRPKNSVELFECWGDFEIDGEILFNHVAVVANRTTLIRLEPNPYFHGKPAWELFTLHDDPNEVYGKGEIESALGLQDVVNVRMNQVIEANGLTVNPQLMVVNDGTIDIDNFISAPGAIHVVGAQGNIAPLQMPSQASLGMQEIGFMLSQHNEATGSMKAFTTSDYQKSATEVSAISGMLNSRFAETIRSIETRYVIPALRRQIMLNQQLMNVATWIRVVEPNPTPDPMTGVPQFESLGPAPMLVSPEMIQGEMDIYPVGASWVANNQQQLGQIIQMAQAFGGIQQAAMTVNYAELQRVCYERAGIRDTYRFLKSKAQVQYDQYVQQQQALAFAAQQQALGLQGGPGGQAQNGGQSGGSANPAQPGGPQSMAGTPRPGTGVPNSPGSQQSNGGPQSL